MVCVPFSFQLQTNIGRGGKGLVILGTSAIGHYIIYNFSTSINVSFTILVLCFVKSIHLLLKKIFDKFLCLV